MAIAVLAGDIDNWRPLAPEHRAEWTQAYAERMATCYGPVAECAAAAAERYEEEGYRDPVELADEAMEEWEAEGEELAALEAGEGEPLRLLEFVELDDGHVKAILGLRVSHDPAPPRLREHADLTTACAGNPDAERRRVALADCC